MLLFDGTIVTCSTKIFPKQEWGGILCMQSKIPFTSVGNHKLDLNADMSCNSGNVYFKEQHPFVQ